MVCSRMCEVGVNRRESVYLLIGAAVLSIRTVHTSLSRRSCEKMSIGSWGDNVAKYEKDLGANERARFRNHDDGDSHARVHV